MLNSEKFEKYLPVLALVGMTLILTLIWDIFAGPQERVSGIFFTQQNLGNIMRQNAEYGIIAVGMTFVILTAGIDLSVGALMAFSMMVAASMIEYFPAGGTGLSLVVIAVGLASGSALGAVNGLGVTWGRMQPFIVTLAMMSIARGFAFLWHDGGAYYLTQKEPPLFEMLGQDLGPVPVSAIIFLVSVGVAYIVLHRTRFGRFVYAIGSNETAARLSGIAVNRVKIIVYTISGFLSGLAAMIFTARTYTGRPDEGVMWELDAIAMVVIGGTNLMGGRGGVGRTLIGALTIGILNNVLGLRGVDPNLQRVLKGAIIIAAVLMQREKKSR